MTMPCTDLNALLDLMRLRSSNSEGASLGAIELASLTDRATMVLSLEWKEIHFIAVTGVFQGIFNINIRLDRGLKGFFYTKKGFLMGFWIFKLRWKVD